MMATSVPPRTVRSAIVAAVLATTTVGTTAEAASASTREPRPGQRVEDPARPLRAANARLEGRGSVGRRILYLAFDGIDVNWCGDGEDDPHDNCSTVMQGAVLPYRGGAAERAAVVQTVAADLIDFDVVVTTERPDETIDYDMEAIGQWSPPAGGFLGIAPKIDCFDGDGGDLSFTLDPPELQPADVAKVVLQELAHTWGLEHVDSTGDILYPTVGNAPDPKFEDQCSPIVYEPNLCPLQHLEFCDDGEQNSYREMLALFGPRQPDDTAPSLAIVSPSDGARVPNTFTLVLELHDDIAPQNFPTSIAFVDGFESSVELAGPGVFPIALNDVPDGEWTIDIQTQDGAGNQAQGSITVIVGDGEPPAAADDSDSGGETTGDAATSDGTSASDSTGAAGPRELDDDGGCGCRNGSPLRGWSSMWLLLALFARRRRH